MTILKYSFEEYVDLVRNFHGHLAPGMLCGGFMIELAYRHLPEGGFYDAISETKACIPDAVQILTPCTIGNGWLKIINTGRFALVLYDKYTGKGVRISIDNEKLEKWNEIKTWSLKLKPKKDQDSKLLKQEIKQAGVNLYKVEDFNVAVSLRGKKKNTDIFICSVCSESFRAVQGGICAVCTGEIDLTGKMELKHDADLFETPVKAVPIDKAVGKKVLHDMTLIIPKKQKGPVFKKGHLITEDDIQILKSIGKNNIYVEDGSEDSLPFIHEDDAAKSFAEKMKGEGVSYNPEPSEGKIDFRATHNGLFTINEQRLHEFNMVSGVVCASLENNVPVKKGNLIAGTRAVPLFLPEENFNKCMKILSEPVFEVKPFIKSKIGIIVTGTEVSEGIIKDKFISLITEKVSGYFCTVVDSKIIPDSRSALSESVKEMVCGNPELIIITGGLSVDPDDVTRFGLLDAGLTDYTYSIPVLPGAMTLTGRVDDTMVLGVPAGALYSEKTAFEILLPRMLAGEVFKKEDLAKMGAGGLLIA